MKLKPYLEKQRINNKKITHKMLANGVNGMFGPNTITEWHLSMHHNQGLFVKEEVKDKIIEYLATLGLSPARTTIF